jgi:hypothetical protein
LLKHDNLYIPNPVSWNLTGEEVAKDDGKGRRNVILLVSFMARHGSAT